MLNFLKKKKFTAIMTISMLIFSMFIPVDTFAVDVLAQSNDAVKTIDLLTFNDFHGAVEAGGKNQGIAKFAEAINEVKKENPNTIVVSGGDNFQGSAISNLTYGGPVNEFMESIGVVASAVGNHEFDWGVDKIAKWAKDGSYDYLASNIYDTTNSEPVTWAKPYKIVEVDGVKIGLIGLATPETAYTTKAENVSNLEFKDPIESAKTWAKVARDNGADVVIALTHLGSMQDYDTGEITGEAADLAKSKTVDAVVSAHTHQLVSGKVDGIPVIQAYKQGRCLGDLKITIAKDGTVDIEPSVTKLYEKDLTEDAAAKAIYDKYSVNVQPILSEVLGTTDKELSHDGFAGPSILGEWTSDVMRKAAGTQIAITNGGGLRTSIAKGNITMGNLYEVMPFDNTLVKMELKGSDLKKVIEHGIMNTDIGWVQEAGVMSTYDSEGKIVTMTLDDGTPINMDSYYTVCTNDFMATGGDKYDFTQGKNVVDTMIPIRDALVKDIQAKKTLSVEKIGYLVEAQSQANTTESATTTASEPQATSNVYTVQSGDTLWQISREYNVSYIDIANTNNIANADLIYIGQTLTIPAA